MQPNKAPESLLFLGIGLWRFGREEFLGKESFSHE